MHHEDRRRETSCGAAAAIHARERRVEVGRGRTLGKLPRQSQQDLPMDWSERKKRVKRNTEFEGFAHNRNRKACGKKPVWGKAGILFWPHCGGHRRLPGGDRRRWLDEQAWISGGKSEPEKSMRDSPQLCTVLEAPSARESAEDSEDGALGPRKIKEIKQQQRKVERNDP